MFENELYFRSENFRLENLSNNVIHGFFKIGKNHSLNVSVNNNSKNITLKNRVTILQSFLKSESSFHEKKIFAKTPIFFPLQKHTNHVIYIDDYLKVNEIMNENLFHNYENFYQNEIFKVECDAFVTSSKNIPIGVQTADCVPILLSANDLIGGIHSGWRGTANGIISKTINIIKKKSKEKNIEISAIIGPSIFVEDYEVTNEFLSFFKNDSDCFQMNESKIFFNLRKKIEKELMESGVKKIYFLNENTYSNLDFASFRRGREKNILENKFSQASVIMLT